VASRRAARAVLAATGLAASLAAACEDPQPPTIAPPPPPVPVAPIAAPRPVASSIAFDLVHTPGGAVLAWGTPARNGGGVRALALDPFGAPRGTEVDVVRTGDARTASADDAPTQIEELSATSSGTRVGLAWVLGGPTPRVQATFSPQETEGFAPAGTLGDTVALTPGSRPARGRIATSTREDGALFVTHRMEDAPCSEAVVAEQGGADLACGRVAQRELDAIAGAVEDAPAMEIPAPCATLLPGAVTTAGTWFYGLCHGTPAPVTTVYAIRPSISYAAANDALPDCAPEALAPLPEGMLLVGACAGGTRSAAVLDPTGRVTATLASFDAAVTCEGGRPVVTLAGEVPPRRIPLTAAVSRVEALLPERVAPRGARATWTGSSLLVATPLEGEVSLRRYECRETGLVRTDLP
jgi:hypothetical protein